MIIQWLREKFMHHLDLISNSKPENVPYDINQKQAATKPNAYSQSNLPQGPLTSVEKSFLFQVNNKSIDYIPAGYWWYQYSIDSEKEIKKLIDCGFLETGVLTDLNAYTVPELKTVLRAKHLHVSGKKAELVKRIQGNFSFEELQKLLFTRTVYVITDKGKPLIKGIVHSATKDLALENYCVQNILEENYDIAYRTIAKQHAEAPGMFGLGVDWKYKFSAGINASDLKMYQSLMNMAENNVSKLIRACLIFTDMYGLTPADSFLISNRLIDSNLSQVESSGLQIEAYTELKDMLARAKYDLWTQRELANIQSYKAMGLKEYTYLATLDCRTCAVCGALDGKVFKVSEAQTGVNLPPMHVGCRCTTVPKIPGVESSGGRIARDPESGQNYTVAASTKYNEWAKTIEKEYGQHCLESSRTYYRKHNKWKR